MKRHSKSKTGFVGIGSHRKPAAVRLSDLRGDVKAKSETMAAIADIAAKKWLEEFFHG